MSCKIRYASISFFFPPAISALHPKLSAYSSQEGSLNSISWPSLEWLWSADLFKYTTFFLITIWLRRGSLECGHQRILSLRFCCLWQYRRYDKTNNFAWLSAKVSLRNRTEPPTADVYHSTDMDFYQPRSSMVRSLLIFELCKVLKKSLFELFLSCCCIFWF